MTSVTYRLLPDFDYVKNNSDSNVEFAHRKVKSGDIYFLDNRTNHDESIDATFRVAGPGFDAHNVLTMEMSLNGPRYQNTAGLT